MKRLTYVLLVLAVLLNGCQDDKMNREDVEGDGVTLRLSSGVPGLADAALQDLVSPLYLLAFDATGHLEKYEQYSGLSAVTPVKLPVGMYTLVYLSGLPERLIGGMQEGARMEDIIVSLDVRDGKAVSGGNIFTGTDSVIVGKDTESNAALRRMVGRLDVNVKGLKDGMTLAALSLVGSPKSVHLNGKAVLESSMQVEIPVAKDSLGTWKGEVIAFPTCDTAAALEFVVEKGGVAETYTARLKSRVEANKIHTINVQWNTITTSWEVLLDVEILPWGASVSEDVDALTPAMADWLAMYKIRDRLAESGSPIIEQWKTTDDVSDWDNVELNAKKRVVGIGLDILSDMNNRKLASLQSPELEWDFPFSNTDPHRALSELRYFTLNIGQIRDFSAFEYMYNLEQLRLKTSVSIFERVPSALKYLDMEAPNLTEIGFGLGWAAKNLEFLSILAGDSEQPGEVESKVSVVDCNFNYWFRLKTLYIQAAPNCQLRDSCLWHNPVLEDLMVVGFSYFDMPDDTDLPALTRLWIENDSILSESVSPVANMKLTFLHLESPKLGYRSLDWLGAMSSLYELSLDNCGLHAVPASFDGLTGLKRLDLNRNEELKGSLPAGLQQRYTAGTLSVYFDGSPGFSPAGVK